MLIMMVLASLWLISILNCLCLSSNNYIIYTHLPQLLSSKRSLMTDMLTSTHDVALIIDIWTDRRQHSFLGVTAHMFNANRGLPQSMLLKFQSFRGSLTGQGIAQAIEECIADNSLQCKVHYVVSDNASNMKKALSFVFHQVLEEL